MTVVSTTSSQRFHGSGSAGPFTWLWRFLDNDDVRVYRIAAPNEGDPSLETRELLAEGADYTLSGAGSYTGGSLTLASALANGTDLVVERATRALQKIDIRNQGNHFLPELHEDVFDGLTLMVQDRDRDLALHTGEIGGLKARMTTAEQDIDTNAAAIAQEIADRQAAVASEAASREAADEAEALARQTADNAETAARIAQDNALAQQIGSIWIGSLTAGDVSVGNYAALRAMTPPASGNGTAILQGRTTAGDGGGGVFRWASGDQSANVTADPQSGIYVVPNTDLTGAGGCWVRQHQETLDIRWFGAQIGGVIDAAPALSAASAYSNANGFLGIYIPAGVFLVGSTVTIYRGKLFGVGAGSILKPSITDGSPVLSTAAGTNFFSFEDFRVDSQINSANFISGSINAVNCTGIQVKSTGGTYSARYHVKNVLVNGCKVGWDIQGFCGAMENAWAYHCETALKAVAMNATRLNFNVENCRKDLEISGSNGIHFDQYLTQGGTHQFGVVSSTIDNCLGVVFTSPYFEQSRTLPFIVFGGVTECRSVVLSGVSFATADNAANDYNAHLLVFDRVNGLTISGHFSTGSHHSSYATTANTKNIIDMSTASSVNHWGPHDQSLKLSPVKNLFPNPNFDLWLRGWPALSFIRCSVAKETSLVRRGENAVRMTLQSGQSNGGLTFVFNDSYLPVLMRGKVVSFYAWIWVPNLPEYDGNLLGAQPLQPSLEFYSDGTGGGTIATDTHHSKRGSWNLFSVSRSVPTDATRFDLVVRLALASGLSIGTEYLVVDSCYLVEGNGQDFSIRNGWVSDSQMNPISSGLGKMIARGTAAPTSTTMIYVAGDTVIYNTPSSGGKLGTVCVTGGSPGTWKPYGAIDA